ncbi:MAG: hypothetical protein ACE5PM_00425 [Candidatus Hydrothermarchaeales archaeon]
MRGIKYLVLLALILLNAPSAVTALQNKPRIAVLANSIDHDLAPDFFEFLKNKGMETIHVTAADFEQYKNEKFIVILGGPDAYEGVGEIVQQLLSLEEQEYLRVEGNRMMYVKIDPWGLLSGQRVSIIAGSDRDQTKQAHVDNREKVYLNVKASEFEGSHFGFMHPEKALKEAMELNVHWARPHPGPFIWSRIEPEKGMLDFKEADDEVKLLQDYDITMVATIWPYVDWDQGACHSRLEYSKVQDFRELGDYRQKPCDMEAYKNFVIGIVERYDGDGVDDMPGLKYPVKYWEVINEPAMKELVFFYGTPEEYFDVLRATYEAVKEADSEARVLNGGIAGFDPEAEAFWQKVMDMGGASYIDVMNHHSISGREELQVPSMKSFLTRNKIEKPIWIPEVEFKAWGLGRDSLSPEEWSEVIVRAFVYAFGEGVDKLFYVGLDMSPGDPESWLLIPKGGFKSKEFLPEVIEYEKQATFYAFKTMVEKIDHFTSVEKIAEGRYRFIVDGKTVFVLWGDIGETMELGVSTTEVSITDISGSQTTKKAEDGKVILVLSESPIFVEEK